MSPRRRQTKTRISSRSSLSEKKAPQFAAPPVVQPKLQRQIDRELPEWKPGGSGQSSPLERLGHSPSVQTKLEPRSGVGQNGGHAVVQRTLDEVEAKLGSGKTTDGLESFTQSTTESSPVNSSGVESGGGNAVIQRTLAGVEAALGQGKTIGGLEAFARTIEFSPENVGFLRACRVWRGLGRGANITAQTKIYNKYIVSYGRVNLSFRVRDALVTRQQDSVTSGVPDVTIFDDAEKEVTSLLVSDVVPRYNREQEDTKLG